MRYGNPVIRSIGLAAAFYGVIALGSRAHAQTVPASAADEAARQHFESGRLHFGEGDYEAALREFEAAYERSGRPQLLYNLYLTSERLGQLDPAIEYLERFLAEGQPEADERAQLGRRLENMRERRDRAAASEAAIAEPAPSPQPEPEPEPRAEPASGDLVPAAIAFGVTGAALLSFAITGGLGVGEHAALRDGCAAAGTCVESDVSMLRALNAAADASWITAAVAGAAGVVLLLTLGLPSEHASESGEARVLPLLSPELAGANLDVSF